MNRCDTLRADFKAYQDGRLPLWKRLQIRRHLRQCAACRQMITEMRQMGRELRQMDREGETLDPGLRARILAGIPEGLPDPPSGMPFFRVRPRSLALWGGLAAAVLVAIVFYPRGFGFHADRTLSYQKEATHAPAASMPAAPQVSAGKSASGPATVTPQSNAYLLEDKTRIAHSVDGLTAGRNASPGGSSFGGRTFPSGRTSSGGGFSDGSSGLTQRDTPALSLFANQAKMQRMKASNMPPEALALQVDDLKAVREKIHQIASAAQGRIVVERPSGRESDYLEIKLPADRYASARTQLSQLQTRQVAVALPASPPADKEGERKRQAALSPAPTAPEHARTHVAQKEKEETKNVNAKTDYQKHTLPSKQAVPIPMRTLRVTLEQKR